MARERGNRAMVGAEPIPHGGLVYDYDWRVGYDRRCCGGIGGAAIELPIEAEDYHAGQAGGHRVCEEGTTAP